jgi:hypothetical protein
LNAKTAEILGEKDFAQIISAWKTDLEDFKASFLSVNKLRKMKRLFGSRFSLSLLDDVVMSVDSGHRYEFCKLLKEHFPDTQFIITTHDRLWAEQMKSAGLVTGKTSIAFYGWTIDSGPLVQSNEEIWDEIATLLAKGKVDSAASALRHHLEYAMSVLADQLGARPQYRADGTYELEEMLTSVLKRAKSFGARRRSRLSHGNGTRRKERRMSGSNFWERATQL